MPNYDTGVLQMITEVHEKINGVSTDVASIKTKLDTTLPSLATKDHVSLAIRDHEKGCSSTSILPRSKALLHPNLTKVIIGVIGALTATIWALIAYLK